MTDDELEQILQECLEQLAFGATIETCLAGYPAQQAQLEPLLRAAIDVTRLPRPALDSAARATIEQRMLEQVALRRIPPSNPSTPPTLPATLGLFGLPIWLIVIVSLGFGLLLIVALLLAPVRGPGAIPLTPNTTVHATSNQPSPTTLAPSPLPTSTLLPTEPTQTAATAEPIIQHSPIATPEMVPIVPIETEKPAVPANPPAIAPSDPGQNTSDDQSRDKNCQGLQLGRDDKKCNSDKDGKDGKDSNEKGKNDQGK